MQELASSGAVEIAPKKGYLSLRRKKQFAMLGPKTDPRFELGLNLKEAAAHLPMKALPPDGMCQDIVSPDAPEQVDEAVIARVRRAYDAAG